MVLRLRSNLPASKNLHCLADGISGYLDVSLGYASMICMDISVQRRDPEVNLFDSSAWAQGFQLCSSGGMVCDICACLVRQDPGSANCHLAWHVRMERTVL